VNRIKVMHIASFNGNIGDNANHNGFRRKLRDSLKCDIKYDEIEMREFYQSWNIKDFNSEKFIKLCNIYDLIVIGGGNFFDLQWDYSYTGTTINISNDTLNKIKTPILFNALGCDIAQGTNENNIRKFENFLDIITNSNKYLVSVRNDGSCDTIHRLYGSKYDKKIIRVPDGAFFLKTKTFMFPEINRNLKSVGINIVYDMKDIRFGKKIKDGIRYDEFINGLAKVINNFLEENKGYQIIFFPHIYSDIIAIGGLLDKIDDRFRRVRIVVAPYLTGKGSGEYIFGLYKECEFILAMRFHSNICSIAQGIPTICLSSYKKEQYLYSEINLSDRVVYVNTKGFEGRLAGHIKDTMENLDQIRCRYRKVLVYIESESHEFYRQVAVWTRKNCII